MKVALSVNACAGERLKPSLPFCASRMRKTAWLLGGLLFKHDKLDPRHA